MASGVWLCIICLFVGAEPGGDGAVIEEPEGELGAFPHGGGAVVEVEHGAGGGGEGVALGWGAAAGEDFAEDGGVSDPSPPASSARGCRESPRSSGVMV